MATKLSRQRDQRRALIKGLATALVMQETITTTKPKAKAALPYLEKLIHKAKADNLHIRRQLIAALDTEAAVTKLIENIAPRFKQRQGGYIKLVDAGWRRGDDARLATLSLTEKPLPAKTSPEVSGGREKPKSSPSQAKTSKPTAPKSTIKANSAAVEGAK